jgi:DNA-binding NarL/FixJ family response regulator
MSGNQIITVSITEHFMMLRQMLCAELNTREGVKVSIAVKDGKELVKKLERSSELPDVCILSFYKPHLEAAQLIGDLKKRWPKLRILVQVAFDNKLFQANVISKGARGYIKASQSTDELYAAVQQIHSNGYYFSDMADEELFQKVMHKEIKPVHFSERELSLLRHAASDKSYAEIAALMKISPKAVEGIRGRLFNKLGVKNRAAMAYIGWEMGVSNNGKNKHG